MAIRPCGRSIFMRENSRVLRVRAFRPLSDLMLRFSAPRWRISVHWTRSFCWELRWSLLSFPDAVKAPSATSSDHPTRSVISHKFCSWPCAPWDLDSVATDPQSYVWEIVTRSRSVYKYFWPQANRQWNNHFVREVCPVYKINIWPWFHLNKAY